MVIGLDIDDVIFSTSEYMGSVLADLDDARLDAIKLDIMRGDVDVPGVREFLVKYLPLAIVGSPVMDGAVEMIADLRAAGNKIVLITARGDCNFPGTEKLNEEVLARNGILYDEIVYNSADKVEACAKYGVEVFVDDSPKNCVEVSNELGIFVVGFESGITAEELRRSGVASVRDWGELKKVIEGFQKENFVI